MYKGIMETRLNYPDGQGGLTDETRCATYVFRKEADGAVALHHRQLLRHCAAGSGGPRAFCLNAPKVIPEWEQVRLRMAVGN